MITTKSQMRKILWVKLKLLFTNEGRHGKLEEDEKSLMSTSNVNEEYKQAFRTKSYIEISKKVQCQLEEQSAATSSCSVQSLHLCEDLLGAHQESLISSNLHKLLANYFEISHEASRICESLLINIHRVRDNHRSIKNVAIGANWSYDQCYAVYENLDSFASRINPFSEMAPHNFQELHNSHIHLLHDLTSQCKKTKKKKKNIIRFLKRAISGFLAIVLLVLTMHCLMGLVAAPGLGIWALGRFKKKRAERKCNEKWPKGLAAKLDVAARGVFIMMNDFETMSRIVKRLHDEMERRKFVADICVRKGKNEMLMEIVREFQMHESRFLEQMEELEKHIYLCFLDIYRSRRLLVREMVK